MASTSPQNWIKQLGLEDRLGTRDLILRGDSISESSHAGAIESCFRRLDLSGVVMVGSVPTIGFLDQFTLDQNQIDRVHRALWNQGLLSILIVSLPSEVRIYTLWEPPTEDSGVPTDLDRLVVEVLHSSADALRMRMLVAERERTSGFDAAFKPRGSRATTSKPWTGFHSGARGSTTDYFHLLPGGSAHSRPGILPRPGSYRGSRVFRRNSEAEFFQHAACAFPSSPP